MRERFAAIAAKIASLISVHVVEVSNSTSIAARVRMCNGCSVRYF